MDRRGFSRFSARPAILVTRPPEAYTHAVCHLSYLMKTILPIWLWGSDDAAFCQITLASCLQSCMLAGQILWCISVLGPFCCSIHCTWQTVGSQKLEYGYDSALYEFAAVCWLQFARQPSCYVKIWRATVKERGTRYHNVVMMETRLWNFFDRDTKYMRYYYYNYYYFLTPLLNSQGMKKLRYAKKKIMLELILFLLLLQKLSCRRMAL